MEHTKTFEFNFSQTLERDGSRLSITPNNDVGFHRFLVDLEHSSGFSLPLLLTELEVIRVLFVWKVRRHPRE